MCSSLVLAESIESSPEEGQPIYGSLKRLRHGGRTSRALFCFTVARGYLSARRHLGTEVPAVRRSRQLPQRARGVNAYHVLFVVHGLYSPQKGDNYASDLSVAGVHSQLCSFPQCRPWPVTRDSSTTTRHQSAGSNACSCWSDGNYATCRPRRRRDQGRGGIPG